MNTERVRSAVLARLQWLMMFVLPGALVAQKTATWDPVWRTVWYQYRLMNPTGEAATNVEVYLPLPHQSSRQEIVYLHLSENGRQQVFTDVHGQKLARYAFARLESGAWVDVGFVAGATLRNLRWVAPAEPVVPGGPELSGEARERYLRALPVYSMESSLMQQTAAELVRGARTDLEKVERLHDYVIRKIRYVRDDTWDPALVVLERGTGSCSEYNYVLSGLCRLAGLPTRQVGGSSSGFRSLPTTDTVYHRWTEVFLSGVGWFPVDCSRDANPVRGRRSHFGRVYSDALVWCQQGGAEEDYLRTDYRAEYRMAGGDPGLKDDHRTRWFGFQPELEVRAAAAWLAGAPGPAPAADLLECALLHWPSASVSNQLRVIEALAQEGRQEGLARAAILPETDELRAMWLGRLCAAPELAATVLERSRRLDRLCLWFRSNEARLVADGQGRFRLRPSPKTRPEASPEPAAPDALWLALTEDVVEQLKSLMGEAKGQAVALMPVVDQTSPGAVGPGALLHARLKNLLSDRLGVRLVDENRFNQMLEQAGIGAGEYWIFALEEQGRPGAGLPEDIRPDYVLVPLCIAGAGTGAEGLSYEFEVKGLEVASVRLLGATARRVDKELATPNP